MRLRLPLALGALAFALVGAGCGATDVADVDPVAAAATKTAAAGSARADYEIRMDVGSERVTMGGEGEFTFGDDVRARMTMEIPSFGLSEMPAGSIELRMLGDMVYMRLPESLGDALPGAATWLAMDLRKTAKAAGLGSLDFSKLGGQQDPAQMLRLLRASSTSVEEDGEVDVRGVRTTRYTAKLDLEKSIEASADELGLSAKQRQELRATARELRQQTGVGEIPVEVYVDADGLLRRFVVTMQMTVEGEQQSMVARSDYFDFGVPVDVEAPPAADVLEYTPRLPGAGG